MRAVHDAEDVVPADEAEAGPGALQVVDGLAHVALGAEHQRGNAVLGVVHLFGLADLHQPLHDLGVGEARVAEDGAAGLDWLDDLVGLVAGKGKAGGRRVDLHCTAQCLLGAGRHTVRLVEDDDLVPTRRQGDFLLGKPLDPIPHHVDASLIAGIQLQDGLLARIAQQLPRQTHNGRGLSDARHARDDDMRHVAVFGDDLEPLDGLGVADNVVEEDGAILFDPAGLAALHQKL